MDAPTTRSMAAPAPLAVRAARHGRTQEFLAWQVTESLRRPGFLPAATISARTIRRIEAGDEVYRHYLLPVLIFLDLKLAPSRLTPTEDQHPGEWLRDLRDAHGLGLRSFCRAARHPSYAQRSARRRTVSPTTLGDVEDGTIAFPSATTMDAIVTGFLAFGVGVDVSDLERAWIHAAPEAAPAWLRQHITAVGSNRTPSSHAAVPVGAVAGALVAGAAAGRAASARSNVPTKHVPVVAAALSSAALTSERLRRRRRRASAREEDAQRRLASYVGSHGD
jgi:hypothetical protein